MEEKKEMVNHPSHYRQGDMECIEGLIGAYGEEEVAIFCKINAMKYIWRLGHKDEEAQEVGKIKWYLDKYLELVAKIDMKEACGKIKEESSEWVIDENKPWIVAAYTEFGMPSNELDEFDLKKKGLIDREVKKIINK